MRLAPSLFAIAAGCHPAPPAPSVSAPPESASVPSPLSSPSPAAEASAAPSTGARPDPLCELTVTHLDSPPNAASGTLGDALRSTPFVTVVVPVLDVPDCSGVGWHHLAFEPFAPEVASGLIRAYRAMPLPAPAPADAPYYLLGATFEQAQVVNLQKVCVPFKKDVNARAEWVVPLRDREEASAWSARLTHRICGRVVPACEGCSRECGTYQGCCQLVEDSCPGPRGAYSTCAGFFPCDAECCD